MRALASTGRFAQIVAVFARHGFGEMLARIGLAPASPSPAADARVGLRLRRAFEELGPCFVKLGQILATRPDLVGADLAAELAVLHDGVAPAAPSEIEDVLAESFPDGAPFVGFEPVPIASASIAQVHAARLATETGEVEVAVKIQRPGIAAVIARDLEVLHVIARLAERTSAEARIFRAVAVVDELGRAITAELDFAGEATNAEQLARDFADDPRVRFPRIYRAASSPRVLTMERFRGLHTRDLARDRAAGRELMRAIVAVSVRMVFEHGVFHADPHPGNIIVLGPPERRVIGFIDLGMVGRLSPSMRDRLLDLVVAGAAGATDDLADALLAIGEPRGPVDVPAFRREVAIRASRHLGKPLDQIEIAAVLRDLTEGALAFEVEVPAELLLAGKALITIEAMCKQLDPELDLLGELRPHLTRLLARRYAPDRVGRELAFGMARNAQRIARLPGRIDGLLASLETGALGIRTTDPAAVAATERLGRRLYSALTSTALIGSGTALLVADIYPTAAACMFAAAGVQHVAHLWGGRARPRPS